MLLRNVLKFSQGKVKPLKVTGVMQGNGVHITSLTGSKDIQIQNPLQALIGSLAGCKLATLKSLSRGSNFKVHSAKFTRIESGLDIAKFMKGGSDLKIETVYLEAQVQSSGTQADLDQWIQKAQNSCPVYQMLKSAGVKIQSKWTNVKTIA